MKLAERQISIFSFLLAQHRNGNSCPPRNRAETNALGNADLFDPVQRERIREEAVRLAALELKQKEIAAAIDEQPTVTAVQRALTLDRAMNAMGLGSPYELVLEPPTDYSKLRRHQNPKYRFDSHARNILETLDGFLVKWIDHGHGEFAPNEFERSEEMFSRKRLGDDRANRFCIEFERIDSSEGNFC